MAEEEGQDKFGAWVGLNAGAIPAIPIAFCFDGKAKDLETLIEENLDRQPLVDYLLKVQGKQLPAKYWAGTQAKIDFMSASERDLRMRYRRRVTGMQVGATSRANAAASLTTMMDNISAIIGGDQAATEE